MDAVSKPLDYGVGLVSGCEEKTRATTTEVTSCQGRTVAVSSSTEAVIKSEANEASQTKCHYDSALPVFRLAERLSPLLQSANEKKSWACSFFPLAIDIARLVDSTSGESRNRLVRLLTTANMEEEKDHQSSMLEATGLLGHARALDDTQGKCVRMFNGIYADSKSPLKPEYIEKQEEFGTSLGGKHRRVKITAGNRDDLHTDHFREMINSQVEEQTRKRVRGLLEQNLPVGTPSVAINTLVVRESWPTSVKTKNLQFQDINGNISNVPCIHFHDVHCYRIENAGVVWHVVPVGLQKLFLLLAIPSDASALYRASTVTGEWIDMYCEMQVAFAPYKRPQLEMEPGEYLKHKKFRTVHADVPKFSIESSWDIREILKSDGHMTTLLDAAREGCSGEPGGKFSPGPILHKTIFSMNANGIGNPERPKHGYINWLIGRPEIKFNRPFAATVMDFDKKLPLIEAHVVDIASFKGDRLALPKEQSSR